MDEKAKSVLSFQDYLVETIEFHINPAFEEVGDKVPVELSLNSEFMVTDDNNAIVCLDCIVFDKPEENNKPFCLMIKINGYFHFDGEVSSEQQRTLLEANATAILYPYLRSLISNITSSAGLQPLILPLINVHKFIMAQRKNKLE